MTKGRSLVPVLLAAAALALPGCSAAQDGEALTVYSGRRFIYGALERDIPIGVANLGPTRADDVASAKVEGRLGEVIPRLAEALLGAEG